MKDEMNYSSAKQLSMGFFLMLVLDGIVIWLANMLFPQQIVLGTACFGYWWALFHSMVMLSLVGTLAVPCFEGIQEMKKRSLTNREWMIGYLVVNFVALWVIARLPDQFGLGIASWWIVLILAIILDAIQGVGMMMVYKKEK